MAYVCLVPAYLILFLPVKNCIQLVIDFSNQTPRPVIITHTYFPLTCSIFIVSALIGLIVCTTIAGIQSITSPVRREYI